MTPSKIFEIMDLAKEARKKGEVFNPLLTGHAGLGKSQIVQQWVKKQKEEDPNFGFIDLRIAYLESPDLIGFPEVAIDENKRARTFHRLPSFWPTEGAGLLLLEEPNRGTTAVLNCLMQLLTDRKIHDYKLPDGWIIASCINPDTAEYDVHQMDSALKDRFEDFEIEFDSNTFIDYMEISKWSENIQSFIKSGAWIYKKPESIGKDGKYISPRTWSKLNAAEVAGADKNRKLHDIVIRSVLGADIGRAYYEFCHKEKPVRLEDLIANRNESLKLLKKMSSPTHYKGDLVAVTVESLSSKYYGPVDVNNAKQVEESKGMCTEEIMVEVAKIIPSDQAVAMIKACIKNCKNLPSKTKYMAELITRYKELTDILKGNIKLTGKE